MPRKICLAFGCFWSLLLLTSSVSADRVFILSRLLAIQQPGNTHGIYHFRGLANTSGVWSFLRGFLSPITNHFSPFTFSSGCSASRGFRASSVGHRSFLSNL